MNINNQLILVKRAVMMQRIADSVLHGHTHYCAGTISVEHCRKLVNKFELNYHVLADRNERARRKRAGLGNANLILWFHNGIVFWWLMVTKPDVGEHAAHSLEKLRDATTLDGRIEIEGFELVRLPKKSSVRKLDGPSANRKPAQRITASSTRLTWRMNKHKYQAWRESFIESIRSSSAKALELLIYQLWSSPGFSEIRSQIGHIAALYKAEVKRSGRKDAPALPKRLGYVRRLSNAGFSLSELEMQFKAQSAMQPFDLHNLDDMVKDLPASSALVMANSVAGNHAL